MDDLEVLVKEWEDLRDEIKRRVEQRNYMTEIMAVLVSGIITAVATASIGNADRLSILGIVPFITVFFMLLIKASYNRHRCITNYIIDLERQISYHLTTLKFLMPFWETSFRENEKTNRRNAYNGFNLCVFLVCGTIFTLYSYFQLTALFTTSLWSQIPNFIKVQSFWSQAYVIYIWNSCIQCLSAFILSLYWVGGIIAIKYSWISHTDIEDQTNLFFPPLPMNPPNPN